MIPAFVTGAAASASKSVLTGVLTKVLGGVFGKKKPMIVYNLAHPAVNQAGYRNNPNYRAAVNAAHAAHVRQFGIGWTSTSPMHAVHESIVAADRVLKRRRAAAAAAATPAPVAPGFAGLTQGQLVAALIAAMTRR